MLLSIWDKALPSDADTFALGGFAIARSDPGRKVARPQQHDEPGLILAMDGYLDNRESLRAALGIPADAAVFSTDAALVLEAWKRWGESGLKRLSGPIALAITDLRDSHGPRIVLYREPLGRRGLHYLATSRLLLVASEPSALLTHPLVSNEPDERWLTDYFALSRPTDNRTPFRDIRKLLARRVHRLHARRNTADPGYARARSATTPLPPGGGLCRAIPHASGSGRWAQPDRQRRAHRYHAERRHGLGSGGRAGPTSPERLSGGP